MVKTADEAAECLNAMGCSVVMKIVSPEILHKTDAGYPSSLQLDDGTIVTQRVMLKAFPGYRYGTTVAAGRF